MNILELDSGKVPLVPPEEELSELEQIGISGIEPEVEDPPPLLGEPIESPLAPLAAGVEGPSAIDSGDNTDVLTGLKEGEANIPLEEEGQSLIEPRKKKKKDPGNNTKQALNLGRVGDKPIQYSDDIGIKSGKNTDKNDYYKFTLNGKENEVDIVVDGLKDNANVELLSKNGKRVLFKSAEKGRKAETIDAELGKGTYYLRVFPQGKAKTKYDLSISAEEILKDPDSKPSGATNLGPLGKKKKVISDEIGFKAKGTRDNSDYYQFTLTEKFNNLNIVLDGLKDNANIQLLDKDGETIIDQSRSKGKNKEIIDGLLDAGTYYLKVEPQGNAKTKYQLSFDSDKINDPDGTLKRADSLGNLGKKPKKQRDEVGFEVGGKRDQKDYYEFNLKKDSEVNVTLDGLNQNVDLKLLDKRGSFLYSSTNKGKDVEQIGSILEKGKYYALVEPVGGDRSEYTLTVDADSNIKDPDGQLPGKSFGKLKNKPLSKKDEIGFKEGFLDESDFYKFQLTKETDLSVTLDKLKANADIELYDKDGTTLIYSSKEKGKKREEISTILDKGTYFIRVKKAGSDKTSYSLGLTGNTKIAEKDDELPGTNLGELGNKKITKKDRIGFESSGNVRDLGDFYNFSLTEQREVNITLDGLTANAKLSLLGTDGREIEVSNKKGKKNEVINEILSPGNYYIGVEPVGGKVKTNYNLGVSSNLSKDDFNNLKNAKQLGTLNLQDKVTEKNRVGFQEGIRKDAGDFYGFSLSQRADVDLSLDGLNQDANLFLLDAKGKDVAKSTAKGSKTEDINKKLAKGDYYVGVLPNGKAKTAYELNLGVTQETLDLSSLRFQPLDIKDGLKAGDKVKVNYQINNAGNTKARAFDVGFYLSKDEGIDTGDVLLGTAKVKSIPGGKNTKKLAKQLTLPTGADGFWQGAGDYYLGTIVDNQGAVAEGNELNNTASQKVSIDIPNDLNVSGFNTNKETVNPGEEFNVSLTVGNTGGSTAGSFQVGYYLSSDNKVTTSDTLLGSDTVKKLAGNATTNLSKNLTLPTSWSGISDYYIGAIADHQNAFVEVNETNNTAKKELSLGAVPGENAGNEFAKARNIGAVGNKAKKFSDWVGDFHGVSNDTHDYYKFKLNERSNLNLSLKGLSANANLYLYDSNEKLLNRSEESGNKNEAISMKLLPGTYHALVFENDGGNTNYDLEISAPPLAYPVPQITGWNVDTALDLGTASATPIKKTEYVGNPHGFADDLNDFYKFQVGKDSTVKIDLTGLNKNADLYLHNSEGRRLADSETLQKANESITKNLTPGTYFAEVQSINEAKTTYDLKIVGTALPTNAAGETPDKALDFGVLGEKTVSDWVGDIDGSDYYKFVISENSTVNLSMTGMSDNANIQLFDSESKRLSSSSRDGNADEFIAINLVPGTYFIEVGNGWRATGTPYTLQASAISRAVNSIGNDLATAQDIGALTTYSQTDWVGSFDVVDYYKFSVAGDSTVNLGITETGGNGELYLYDSEGKQITRSVNVNKDEAITANLNPGTYYAGVSRYWSGGDNVNYNFTASATAIPDTAGNNFEAARDLGALNGTLPVADWVGNIDSHDYFKFNVAQNSAVNLNLTGLAANADLYLYNSSQDEIFRSTNEDAAANEAIALNLPSGTYYALVQRPWWSGDTNYNFSLSAAPLAYSPANLVGNTEAQTKNIGALVAAQTFTDFVGSQYGIATDKNDFYQFTLAEDSTVNLSLGGLSANADLLLRNSEGSWITDSTNFSNLAEGITRNLVAGTYIVEAKSIDDASTGYNLQMSAVAHPDAAGETFDTARSAGNLTATQTFSDWVGNIDGDDYYQFSLDANRTVNIQLSGVSDEVQLNLFDSAGNWIYRDINGTRIDPNVDIAAGGTGAISAVLAPGVYFVEVDDDSFDNTFGTNYSLSMSAG